ncbi:uncharacterized protein [Prorops nasuta]|uniref:uncharacterized protein n=1 Tax=Prorops nasuta TaxID=863751 RepID=UPI0034CD8609
MNAITLVAISSVVVFLVFADSCCRINLRDPPGYELIRSKVRSEKIILSTRNVQSLEKCMDFSVSKKALAFNYGRVDESINANSNTTETSRANDAFCEALQCPETNLKFMKNDTNYQYYSMYPINITSSNGNVECVPKAGLFLFSNVTLNYTDARAYCKKFNASLAHVISDERSSGFAEFISDKTPSFVGLSNLDNDRLWKNEFGEPLDCFDYRAWGPGEPSHSRGCVGITRLPGSKSLSFWKVLPCKLSFRFICEIFPYKKSSSAKQKEI